MPVLDIWITYILHFLAHPVGRDYITSPILTFSVENFGGFPGNICTQYLCPLFSMHFLKRNWYLFSLFVLYLSVPDPKPKFYAISLWLQSADHVIELVACQRKWYMRGYIVPCKFVWFVFHCVVSCIIIDIFVTETCNNAWLCATVSQRPF